MTTEIYGGSNNRRISDEETDSTETSQCRQILNNSGENVDIDNKEIIRKRGGRRPRDEIESGNA